MAGQRAMRWVFREGVSRRMRDEKGGIRHGVILQHGIDFPYGAVLVYNNCDGWSTCHALIGGLFFEDPQTDRPVGILFSQYTFLLKFSIFLYIIHCVFNRLFC